MGEEESRGRPRPDRADLSSESGWVTTEVAARAVRVSPRTIRRYIEQGKLEAKPQGEGVRREWLISAESLHALRATRTTEETSPQFDRVAEADTVADSVADVLREMAAKLERWAEEAAELRVRLELTERAQSTLEEERRQALDELAEARRRQEEIEQERDELRQELESLKGGREDAAQSPVSPKSSDASRYAAGAAEAALEVTQEAQEEKRKGWIRRFFGF